MRHAVLVVGVIGAFALSSLPVAAESTMQMGKRIAMEEGRLVLSLTPTYTPSPWTSEMGYAKQAGRKFAFGAKNLLLGWTDLFVEPKEASEAGMSPLSGVGCGLKDALENTLGGVVHLATFALPQVDAPLPEGGIQL